MALEKKDANLVNSSSSPFLIFTTMAEQNTSLAAIELDLLLEKHGLNLFTSAEKIGQWIRTLIRQDDEMDYLALLGGLMKNAPQEDVEELCEKKTTDTDVYRFYANKAMIHFNMGQEECGSANAGI